MPFKDPAKKKAHAKARWKRIKNNPKLLKVRREQVARSQRVRMKDPKVRTIQYKRTAKWRSRNPNYSYTWHLKKRYGITADQYRSMWDAQGGCCAICGNPEKTMDPRFKGIRRLAVDHCHKTGKVRGLLCYLCNNGMGKLGEDPRVLRAAADYLERHNAAR